MLSLFVGYNHLLIGLSLLSGRLVRISAAFGILSEAPLIRALSATFTVRTTRE